MARLTRKNMKVFAANASNNGVFGSLEAGNPTVTNDVEQIQGLTAWGAGWNAATLTAEKLPPLEEFQGVQYVTTYQQAYLMQEGMPEWNANVTYYKGSLTKKVTTTGFQIYNSLTDDNTNHQLSDTANWKLVMDSDNLYAMDNAVVHIAGDETITGAKTFTNETTIKRDILFNNNDAVKGTNPQQNPVYWGLVNGDSSGAGRLGLFETKLRTDGQVETYITAYKNESGSDEGAYLRVVYPASGNPFATAPTPATSDNSEKIATTAFVKNQGYLTSHQSLANYVTLNSTQTISGQKTFSAVTYGKASDAANSLLTTVASLFETSGTLKRYLKLGNGWIIQVGEFTYESGNGEVEVLLNQTMTSTKYFVGITFLTTARNSPGCVTGRYTNKFKYKSSSFQGSGTALYIVIGK